MLREELKRKSGTRTKEKCDSVCVVRNFLSVCVFAAHLLIIFLGQINHIKCGNNITQAKNEINERKADFRVKMR